MVAMLVFAIIAVALMTDPGNEPWYHKTFFEVIQHIIMQARPRRGGGPPPMTTIPLTSSTDRGPR